MKKLSIAALICISLSSIHTASAASNPCAQFSTTPGWSYAINIKNTCTTPLNLSGATVSFNTNMALSGTNPSIWGFNNISYPNNAAQLTLVSQSGSSSTYSYTYQFGNWAALSSQELAPGQSTNLVFSPPNPSTIVLSALGLTTSGSPIVSTGSVSFSGGSTTIPTSTIITMTGSNSHLYTIQNSFNGTQYTANGIAFDTYKLTGYYVSGNSQIPLSFSPASFTLNATNSAQAVKLTIPSVSMVNVTLNMAAKPNDTVATQIPVTVADTTKNSSQIVNVAWGQALPVSVISGDNIALSASNMTGLYKSYQFSFVPAQFKAGGSGQNVQISYATTALPTGTVQTTVNGLPSGQSANLQLTNTSTGQVYPLTLANGSSSNNLPTGNYSVTANVLSVNGKNYIASVTPSQIVVSQGHSSTITISYVVSAGVAFSPYMDITVNANWSVGAGTPYSLTSYIQTTGLKSVRAAFIDDAGSCIPAWAGTAAMPATGGSNAWGYSWFMGLQAQNISTIISFGGEDGTDISVNCSNSALVTAYQNVITTYNPSGLDFDIEGALVATPSAYNNMISALVKIQAKYPNLPISLTLPVLPSGLDNNGLAVVQAAKTAGLNFDVNIMAMDYGSSSQCPGDMGQCAIQAINSVEGQLATVYGNSKSTASLYNMIQVTPMIGVNDTQGEYFTLADANAVAAYASQQGLSGIAMWSQARDTPCTSTSANPTCSGANSSGVQMQTNIGDFAKAFLSQ